MLGKDAQPVHRLARCIGFCVPDGSEGDRGYRADLFPQWEPGPTLAGRDVPAVKNRGLRFHHLSTQLYEFQRLPWQSLVMCCRLAPAREPCERVP